MTRAIFLDFDGVLGLTTHIKARLFCDICEEYIGMPRNVAKAENSRLEGKTRKTKFEHFLAYAGAQRSNSLSADYLTNIFSMRVREEFSKNGDRYRAKGVERLLRLTKKHGLRTVIVSAGDRDEITDLVGRWGLDGLLDEIYGGVEDKSAVIIFELDANQIRRGDAIMVGDSRSDERAAKLCSVRFIGIGPEFASSPSTVEAYMSLEDLLKSDCLVCV